MGGEVLPVGPFSGGLNIAQDARLISDNELSTCKNFDIGVNGELVLRRGGRTIAGPAWDVGSSAVLAVARIASGNDEVYASGIVGGVYSLQRNSNLHAPAWAAVRTYAANVRPGDGVQYNNKLWIPTTGSGTADGISVDIASKAVTTVPTMPKGTKSFIYKNRMFVFDEGAYRVYYSASLFPDNWPAANFFDINPGDGEPIVAAIVSGESVIFFKQNSTWILYYDTDPGLGSIRQLNTDVGVTTKNSVAVVANDVYVLSNRGVQRLTNSFYEDISKNLDLFNLRTALTIDTSNDYIRPFGGKLLARLKTPTGFRYFVYGLETNVWTEYVFTPTVGVFERVEDADHNEHYLAASPTSTNFYVYTPYGDNTGVTEELSASAATKFYDYGDSAGWKRIFWHSAEAKSSHAFSIQIKPGEDQVGSTTFHALPASSHYEIFKNFLGQRFRTVQYSIFAGGAGTLGGNFTFVSGSVAVAAKKRVVQRETV